MRDFWPVKYFFFFCLHFLLELLLPLKIVTKYFKLSNVLLSALSGCSFSPCLCEEKQGWMVWDGACLSNSPVSSADTLAAIKLPTHFSAKPMFSWGNTGHLRSGTTLPCSNKTHFKEREKGCWQLTLWLFYGKRQDKGSWSSIRNGRIFGSTTELNIRG